ncbi:unknown (plasmid) [Crocosphaera subtropica ATCC 51142]|uniref:Uncharacterized protein n=1 Tax=Crocosphaera subtropica (strain ATCC 51142 / BH68) TaxID=43989 RepID=B1X375_CROS5|nr:unknown [Crocosphaera subtropica ATCC 51142]
MDQIIGNAKIIAQENLGRNGTKENKAHTGTLRRQG